MEVTIVGLDHQTQWQDSTGMLKRLLEGLCSTNQIDLIAEEASAQMPTTVGQRLAQRQDIPWLNVDMSNQQRVEAGIDHQVPTGPLFDESYNFVGSTQSYEPAIQGVREKYWLNQILRCHCERVILVCGAIHLDTISESLKHIGHVVCEVRAWEQDWYKASAGELLIFNKDGRRYSEFRSPRRPS